MCNDYNLAKKDFNVEVANNLALLMTQLKFVDHINIFYTNPVFRKYRVHELSGKKRGVTSFRISYSYRLETIVEVQVEEDEIIILEVSNHYGD